MNGSQLGFWRDECFACWMGRTGSWLAVASPHWPKLKDRSCLVIKCRYEGWEVGWKRWAVARGMVEISMGSVRTLLCSFCLEGIRVATLHRFGLDPLGACP